VGLHLSMSQVSKLRNFLKSPSSEIFLYRRTREGWAVQNDIIIIITLTSVPEERVTAQPVIIIIITLTPVPEERVTAHYYYYYYYILLLLLLYYYYYYHYYYYYYYYILLILLLLLCGVQSHIATGVPKTPRLEQKCGEPDTHFPWG